MQTSWIAYWKPSQFEDTCNDGDLRHIANDQLWRVKKGDVVWIVSAPNGLLMTLGPIRVTESILSKAAAKKRLGSRLYDAKFHLVVSPKQAETPRRVDLSGVAPHLTFITKDAKCRSLKIRRGRIDPQQLRTMRQLTQIRRV